MGSDVSDAEHDASVSVDADRDARPAVDATDDTDSANSTHQFPTAKNGIEQLSYSRYRGDGPCDPLKGFEGELTLTNGTELSVLIVTYEDDVRQETTRQGEITAEQRETLQELVLAVPPKDEQDGGNCQTCEASGIWVGDEYVARTCCGVCSEDFQPAFDDVADFLVRLVPSE